MHFLCNNIFISIVAVCMSWGTNVLFDLSLDLNYYIVLFFATLSSYCLHWYFTELTINQTSINQFRSSLKNKKGMDARSRDITPTHSCHCMALAHTGQTTKVFELDANFQCLSFVHLFALLSI